VKAVADSLQGVESESANDEWGDYCWLNNSCSLTAVDESTSGAPSTSDESSSSSSLSSSSGVIMMMTLFRHSVLYMSVKSITFVLLPLPLYLPLFQFLQLSARFFPDTLLLVCSVK